MSEKARHPEKVHKPINPIKKKPEWIKVNKGWLGK